MNKRDSSSPINIGELATLSIGTEISKVSMNVWTILFIKLLSINYKGIIDLEITGL